MAVGYVAHRVSAKIKQGPIGPCFIFGGDEG